MFLTFLGQISTFSLITAPVVVILRLRLTWLLTDSSCNIHRVRVLLFAILLSRILGPLEAIIAPGGLRNSGSLHRMARSTTCWTAFHIFLRLVSQMCINLRLSRVISTSQTVNLWTLSRLRSNTLSFRPRLSKFS